jgi:hypothetical protein
VGAIAIVAIVVVAIPSQSNPPAAPTVNEGPAQLAAQTPDLRVTAEQRRAIDATLDRWVPAGVGRRDMRLAWQLSGPELKNGSTLAEWRRGDTPIPAYPVGGDRNYHGWSTLDAGRGYVDFNLLVHPRKGKHIGAYVFAGQMIERQGRWLVNRFYTTAIMNPVRGSQHEFGPADVGPSASTAAPAIAKPHRFGLVPVLLILGLIVLIPVVLGTLAFVRARRFKQRVRAAGRRELPPLPPTPGPEAREREPASRA